MAEVKEQQKAIGADTLGDWAEFAAPALAGRAARLYSRTKMADRHRPLFNVTISNVPGPPFPLYSIGARMVANFPVGPIMDGGGLNMTVMSYLDQLDFGLQACPDVLPDVWSLAEGLPARARRARGGHRGAARRGREAEPLSLTPSAARIDAATSGGVRVVAVLGARPEEPLAGRRACCAARRARAGAARSG